MGEGSFMTKISVLELIINVIASLFLVKYFGLVGIALGTVVAYSFEKIMYVVYLRRKHQIAFGDYVDGKWFAGYSLLLILIYVLVESIY